MSLIVEIMSFSQCCKLSICCTNTNNKLKMITSQEQVWLIIQYSKSGFTNQIRACNMSFCVDYYARSQNVCTLAAKVRFYISYPETYHLMTHGIERVAAYNSTSSSSCNNKRTNTVTSILQLYTSHSRTNFEEDLITYFYLHRHCRWPMSLNLWLSEEVVTPASAYYTHAFTEPHISQPQ